MNAATARPGGGRGAVGLAFDCQLLDAVPTDAHDQTVDYVCCAEELIRTAAGAAGGAPGGAAGGGAAAQGGGR